MRIILIAAVAAVFMILEIYRETHTFKVTRYTVYTDKLKKSTAEKKVIFISDLHNCTYGKDNEKLLKAVRDESPDLILSSGDILIGNSKAPTETAERFLTEACKIAPVYCANGNHEQRLKEGNAQCSAVYADYKERLAKTGVRFLENDSEILLWEQCKVRITGLEIPLSYYKKYNPKKVTLHEIEERIGKAGSEYFEVLLAHNPAHAESYQKWGADLTVSGHLHGGIVRIPFGRGVITPQIRLLPKYSGGHYRLKNMQMVVSRGLGTHTVNIRLFNEAELAVLHIKGTK